jgi:hypothetical protein
LSDALRIRPHALGPGPSSMDGPAHGLARGQSGKARVARHAWPLGPLLPIPSSTLALGKRLDHRRELWNYQTTDWIIAARSTKTFIKLCAVSVALPPQVDPVSGPVRDASRNLENLKILPSPRRARQNGIERLGCRGASSPPPRRPRHPDAEVLQYSKREGRKSIGYQHLQQIRPTPGYH